MEVGSKTDIGKKREKNEDSIFFSKDRNIYIVADGIGGNNAGDVASKLAVKIIGEHLGKNLEENPYDLDEEKITSLLKKIMDIANQALLETALKDETLKGMGTTVTLCVILDRAYLMHIGDSRAYKISNGKIEQLTRDHTLVEELIKEGSLTKDDAKNHPRKNIITRALGVEEIIQPDLYSTEYKKGDIIILCTDGLYNYLADDEIFRYFENNNDIQKICDAMVEFANEAGGMDNITILAIKNN